MNRLGSLSLRSILAVFAATGLHCPRATAAETPGADQFHKVIKPILTEYCYDCHADGMKKGGVSFDEFKSDRALLEDRELWWNALKYLRAGIMPPAKKPRPSEDEKQHIANWIKTAVFQANSNDPDPGRVTMRRLNRVEYRNTIRDLMGIDFNTEEEFPPDDTGYGFDNIGDVLTLSPMLLEKYVAAAKAIVTEAVPVVSRMIPEITITGNQLRHDSGDSNIVQQAASEKFLSLPYDKPANVSTNFEAKHGGSYRVSLNLAVKGEFNFDPRKCRLAFKLDDRELLQQELVYNNKSLPFEFNETLAAGAHRLSFELQPLPGADEETNTIFLRIHSVTVRGPLEKEHWVRPRQYDRFFTGEVPESPAERRSYAREVLRSFAGKAFRRPVDDRTVERLSMLAESVYTQPGKTFETGIAYAMQAVIASPRFLFRIEENLPRGASAGWSLVDEYTLASRLSYFLWSTMPDNELIQFAQRGELRKNFAAQVKRMMADPRSGALIENFTGQWLQVRDLQGISIDARTVLSRDAGQERQMRQMREARQREALARAAAAAQTNGLAGEAALTNALVGLGQTNLNLTSGSNGVARAGGRRGGFRFQQPRFQLDRDTRRAMKNETEMFFASVVREDRSLTTLIDSDYTFLNEKLATLYGLTNLNVTGSEMRRVTLPADSPRGGVITEGTVLVVTSNPDRTSPVKRGLFVLNNILGTPAPPPPPNVPALEASEKDFTNSEPTLRAVLELHRNQPLCSSCHQRMDPIGLGLENFNALGMWRGQERNQAIDPAGKLITGESFNDVRELKRILAHDRRSDFYRCLTEKLLTYALGRGLEYYDVETVDQIVQRLERENGRFSALLTGILESAPFQKQRNEANAVFSDAAKPAESSKAVQIVNNPSPP